MRRLTASEVKIYRNARLRDQGGLCLLCGEDLPQDDAVLDHCHAKGVCRGVLHRGCNVLLGKIENGRRLNRLTEKQRFEQFVGNLLSYLERDLGVLHPTHKTEQEKKLLKNKRARRKRLADKLAALTPGANDDPSNDPTQDPDC